MFRLILPLVVAGAWVTPSLADTTQARCDIYPAGSDTVEATIPCTFSQRQGYITITREDGVVHDLEPTGEAAGNFRDQNANAVYRNSGLGDQGLIFRFPEESVFVYWSTAGLNPADPDNPTAPFTTDDYDATTILRCRAVGEAEFGNCPAGVLRMENRQASIVVQSPDGEQFTINFMTDYVNATNREAEAVLDGDLWTVTINGKEIYEIPLAAIEGG
ncbi:hypothetical protein AAFN47_04370 [Hoeflea sp. CAU 1731]